MKEFQEKLPDLVRGYKASDIFNMDESGLFYRALPKKTLKSAGDKCSGGKQSKERLTASFCVSMEGEFEQTVMIGKSENPRCFKNLDKTKLGVTWYAQRKAWMTGDLFSEWVKGVDKRVKMPSLVIVDTYQPSGQYHKDVMGSRGSEIFSNL